MATELPPITVTPGDNEPIPGDSTGGANSGTDPGLISTLTPAGVSDLEGQSNYYLVVITSSRYGDVYAWLPDDVRLWIPSSWGPIVGNIDSVLANYIGTLIGPINPGTTFFSKKLTAQEWRGSEPLSLQLPLHFFATKDANNEVVEPIKRLIKMSLPRKISDDFFGLQPPGPVPTLDIDLGGIGGTHIHKRAKDQDIINVYIGNFIRLTEVFIQAINGIEFKSKLSKDGLPMEGLCDVIFKTVFAPTSQDIDDYISSTSASSRPDIRLG